MLMVMDTLRSAYLAKDILIFRCLIAALAIGSVTPLFEVTRTISVTNERIKNAETVCEEDKPFEVILSEANFCGDIENNFFFEHIAK